MPPKPKKIVKSAADVVVVSAVEKSGSVVDTIGDYESQVYSDTY